MQPIYVVGFGMVDGLGYDYNTCWDKMIDDNNYTSDIPEMVEQDYKINKGMPVNLDELVLQDNLPLKIRPSFSNSQMLGFHSTKRAIEMAGLPHSKNVSIVFSSVSNDIEMGVDMLNRVHNSKRVLVRRLVNRIPEMTSSHLSSLYGFMGNTVGLQASCATGLASIDYGMYEAQESDYVIVGGSDAGCCNLAVKYFNQLGAIANHSAPFDENRAGFLMGEGGATLVLMREEMVEKYKVRPIARLYPMGKSNDAVEMTSPASDGRGATIAIGKALQHVDSVDAVNAHATSTPVGDEIEYNTIVNSIGEVPIWAPKSKIGHTLATAGVIETIYSILSMNRGVIPHIHNLETCTFDDKNLLVRENMFKPAKRMLNNSFGFGGKNMAQVIEIC